VQVPHGEGVANHIVPESCEVIREGIVVVGTRDYSSFTAQ